MIRRPPRSTQGVSSAASDVYKRQVPRGRFLIASMAGMLPRTLFFFWVGTQAQDLLALLQDPNAGTMGKLLMGVLVVISLGGIYVLLNRAIKKALAKKN